MRFIRIVSLTGQMRGKNPGVEAMINKRSAPS